MNEAPLTLAEHALTIHERLLQVYGLPEWRHPLPALDELVSTILSQNTNDLNRDAAFNRLRERFPAWEQVRDARLEDVVAAIRPAGLANRKGPRIQAALREITAERGRLELDFLRELPPEEAYARLVRFHGVGPKTAAIVMLFSLDMPAFPVDTHIHRLAWRWGLSTGKNVVQTELDLKKLFPITSWNKLHLQIIYFGRKYCPAKSHSKKDCPICSLYGIKELE